MSGELPTQFLNEIIDRQKEFGAQSDVRKFLRSINRDAQNAGMVVLFPGYPINFSRREMEQRIHEAYGDYSEVWPALYSGFWEKLVKNAHREVIPHHADYDFILPNKGPNEVIRRPINSIRLGRAELSVCEPPDWTLQLVNQRNEKIIASSRITMDLSVEKLKYSSSPLLDKGPLQGVLIYEPVVIFGNGLQTNSSYFYMKQFTKRMRVWDKESTEKINNYLTDLKMDRLTWYWDRVESAMKQYSGGLPD